MVTAAGGIGSASAVLGTGAVVEIDAADDDTAVAALAVLGDKSAETTASAVADAAGGVVCTTAGATAALLGGDNKASPLPPLVLLAPCGEGVSSDMSIAPADGEPLAPAPLLVPPPEVWASPCIGAGVSIVAAGGDEMRVKADNAGLVRDRGVAGEGTDASEVTGEEPTGSARGSDGRWR